MVQPYDPVATNRPSYWDRNPRSYFQEPLNEPENGLMAPVVFTDDDTPVTVEFTCSHRQLGEFLDCIEQGSLLLYPNRRAQIYFDFVRNWDFPKGPKMQLRAAGCGVVEVSNDHGQTWATLWDASCATETVDGGAIQSAIDDLTYWRDQYRLGGPGNVAPTVTSALVGDRDMSYCVAAQALVESLCEAEITRREEIEKTAWAIIGALIVDIITVILVGSFAIPALIAVAIAGALAGAAAAQFHVLPLEDLRSPGKRRDTACCISDTLAGLGTGSVEGVFRNFTPCAAYPLAIAEIYPMLDNLDLVVSFLRLAETAIPDIYAGTVTCPCGTEPEEQGYLWFPASGGYDRTGVITGDWSVAFGAARATTPNWLGNHGYYQVLVTGMGCQPAEPYHRIVRMDMTIYLENAQNLFVETAGFHNFDENYPGQNLHFAENLWVFEHGTENMVAFKQYTWGNDTDGNYLIGRHIGAVPNGTYTLRVETNVCTSTIMSARLDQIKVWTNRDDSDYFKNP